MNVQYIYIYACALILCNVYMKICMYVCFERILTSCDLHHCRLLISPSATKANIGSSIVATG